MPRQVASVRVPARTDAANHPPVVTNDLNYESRDGGNIAWPGEEERKAVVREQTLLSMLLHSVRSRFARRKKGSSRTIMAAPSDTQSCQEGREGDGLKVSVGEPMRLREKHETASLFDVTYMLALTAHARPVTARAVGLLI